MKSLSQFSQPPAAAIPEYRGPKELRAWSATHVAEREKAERDAEEDQIKKARHILSGGGAWPGFGGKNTLGG